MGTEDLLKRLLEMKGSGEARKLRVLDSKNDPLWASPARVRDAMWISKLWDEKLGAIWAERQKRRKESRKAYDRGLHYILVSLGVECPWGQNRRVHSTPLYVNVDSDFSRLVAAIRDARNWDLLPWDIIEDRKHVGLETWVNYGHLPSLREVRPFESFDGDASYSLGVNLPDVEEVRKASFQEDDFDEISNSVVERVLDANMTDLTPARYQPFYVAVVSEKSGMRDVVREVLAGLDYGFDFLNFEGQASTTVVRDFVHERLLGEVPSEHPIKEKKIRIFYLSDYDYAGRVMPPAFIQKLLFHLWKTEVDLDIKVKPIALTRQLVEEYDLPPAPVPARSLGAKTLQDRWLREFGSIVELDSLDSLHPGVLEDIITAELEKYVDRDLAKKVREKLDGIAEEATGKIVEAVGEWKEDWVEAREKLSKAMDEMNKAIAAMRINETLSALKETLEKLSGEYSIPDLVANYRKTLNYIYVHYDQPPIDVASSHEVEESDDWLFDSKRDSEEQAKRLRKYKP